jgi:hypothetical protein
MVRFGFSRTACLYVFLLLLCLTGRTPELAAQQQQTATGGSTPVYAGNTSASLSQDQDAAPAQPSNLTLWNFFTAGWGEQYYHRETPGGAPDMALLHVTTNFLEREFRFDSYFQQNLGSDSTKSVLFTDGLIAYGLDRRFMVEVVANYEWKDAVPGGTSSSGSSGALVGRVQLVDIPGSSWAFNFRVTSPNEGIVPSGVQNNKDTVFFPALAGWQDLTCYGLSRVGLYFSIGPETYVGPTNDGQKHNDVMYDVSVAKTWTEPNTPCFGNFTTFVEFYNTTNLDGSEFGNNAANVTPGFRVTLWPKNVLMGGIDLPLSNPHDFSAAYRLTYIRNF